MSIAETVKEIKNLTAEIKTRSKELRDLRAQKKAAEANVLKWLHENEQPGVKYKTTVMTMEEKSKRTRKKKAEKMKDGMEVLRKYNVQNCEKVLEEIVESMRGNKSVVSCLKYSELL